MSHGTPSAGQLLELASVIVKHTGKAFTGADADVLQGWIDDRSGAVAQALRVGFLPTSYGEVSGNVARFGDSYFLRIDGRSLPEMVSAGRYDRVDKRFLDEGPSKFYYLGRREAPQVEARIMYPACQITADQALVLMYREGFRPASVFELLAFGEQYPEEQRNFAIAALGSVWPGQIGDDAVAYLRGSKTMRELRTCLTMYGFDPRCRFLAVRVS